MKIYQRLARTIQARENCREKNNTEWFDKHSENALDLVKQYMPSGSGIDSGTVIELDDCNENKLVFTFSYHHMDENGGYDGWTAHQAIVTPDLASGFNIRITGRDRNQIKDYLYEIFSFALNEETE